VQIIKKFSPLMKTSKTIIFRFLAPTDYRDRQQSAIMTSVFLCTVRCRERDVTTVACILNASEADREIRPILQRFELGLEIGVVIRDIGSAMGLGDIQID
jgi:hypothetical protein